MKKMKEKIVALCSMIAILAFVFVAPASAETAETISILCKDQAESNPQIYRGWGHRDALGNQTDDTTKTISAKFDFTVEKAGWYDAEFIIASNSSYRYSAGNFSKVNYWFDSDSPKWLSDSSVNTASPTVETLNYDPLSTAENFEQTKLLEPIYLEAGSHSINFITDGVNRSNIVMAGFYSIKLNYVDFSVINVMCRDQKAANSSLEEWGIGGNYGAALGKKINNNNNTQKINASFKFNIKNEGWYSANFIIASNSGEEFSAGNFSKVNYWFDSDSPKWLSDSAVNPSSPTVTTVNKDPLNTSRNYEQTKLLEPVYFAAGEHTINFETFEDSREGAAHAAFYSIKLENVDVSSLNDITLHGGDYPNMAIEDKDGNVSYVQAETDRFNLKDKGKIALIYRNSSKDGAENGYKFTIPFKVYTDGYYDCNIRMRSYARLPVSEYGWSSPAYVGIDNEAPVWVKSFATDNVPKVNAKIISTFGEDTYNWEPAQWQECALKPMHLAAGNHTMTIHIPEQAPNQESDLYIFALDSIHIRPAEARTSFTAEGEELRIKDKSDVVENSVYSNGSAVKYTQTGTVSVPFYLSSDGNYNFGAIAKGTASYRVDGTAVSGISSIEDLQATVGSGWNRYKSPVMQLNAGVHTLEIDVNDSYMLDKIDIIKAINVTDISLQGDDIISEGQSKLMKVINQDGEEVSLYDVDSLCFESSDENIAAVDGYGNVTAVNAGTAVITVGAAAGGKNMTASKKIYVPGKTGLYLKDAAINGNDVTVTLAAASDAAASKVIVASYGVVNGVPTSFKSVNFADFGAISANTSDTKTISLTSIEASDHVCVFVFDGLDTMVPLYAKTIVR